MIKLYNGQITDILPEMIAADIGTKCLSFAIQKEHQRILDLADRTRTIVVIHQLPEQILDVLAVELRTPYYREDMDIETKRNIIAHTLVWHTKAGTPAAVAELIETIFGEGDVVEWFDYDEPPFTPGTFDIITNARMTKEITEQFLAIIQRVKNARSHIRRVLIERRMDAHWYSGSAGQSNASRHSINSMVGEHEAEGKSYAAAGAVPSPRAMILNHLEFDDIRNDSRSFGAAGAAGYSKSKIDNNVPPKSQEASGIITGAAGMASRATKIIENNVAPKSRVIWSYFSGAAAIHTRPVTVVINDGFIKKTAVQSVHMAAVAATSHSKIPI